MKLIKFNRNASYTNVDKALSVCRIVILLFSGLMFTTSYAASESKCGANGIKCSAYEGKNLKSEEKHQKLRSIKNPEDINDDDSGINMCTNKACENGYHWVFALGKKFCRPC